VLRGLGDRYAGGAIGTDDSTFLPQDLVRLAVRRLSDGPFAGDGCYSVLRAEEALVSDLGRRVEAVGFLERR
jgi:hypothetical protein